MRSEKPILLIGAGASVAMGIPTMKGLVEAFEKYCRTYLDENIDDLLQYCKLNRAGMSWDLEELLRMIKDIENIKRNFGVRILINEEFGPGDKDRTSIATISGESFASKMRSLAKHSKELKKELLLFVRTKCLRFHRHIGVGIYRNLFRAYKKRTIKIFTTNYDTIIENSCNDLGISYGDGFDRNEEYGKWTGDFGKPKKTSAELYVQLYKLHGSATWYLEKRRNYVFKFTPTDISDSKNVDQMMIYPTQLKEINNPPYNLIHYEFEKAIEESAGCLAIGHSFRDDYIRNWLAHRLKKGNFQLDIVDPSADIRKKEIFESDENVGAIKAGFKDWSQNLAI